VGKAHVTKVEERQEQGERMRRCLLPGWLRGPTWPLSVVLKS